MAQKQAPESHEWAILGMDCTACATRIRTVMERLMQQMITPGMIADHSGHDDGPAAATAANTDGIPVTGVRRMVVSSRAPPASTKARSPAKVFPSAKGRGRRSLQARSTPRLRCASKSPKPRPTTPSPSSSAPADASVTRAEFFDPMCGARRAFHPVLHRIRESYPTQEHIPDHARRPPAWPQRGLRKPRLSWSIESSW